MINPVETEKIDVVLLCGGKGKRLKSVVSDRPKPMAEINGRPFLDILIEYVANFGFKRFILCTGYMGNVIKRYYQNRKDNLEILFSKEEGPLDTGGAIKNAGSLIRSSPFLVMNGDSFCKINLNEFVNFHLSKNALVSIAATNRGNNNDCGVITLNDSQRIIKFSEKTIGYKNNFINAGIYLFLKAILSLMPAGRSLSLEKDFFPAFINKEVYGYITQERLIDIGTPERYEKAKKIFSKNIYFRI